MRFSCSCDSSNLIIRLFQLLYTILMQRVQLEVSFGNLVNHNAKDDLRKSSDDNPLQLDEGIHISCTKALNGTESVTLPTEENEDGVNVSVGNGQQEIKNENNNFHFNSNVSRVPINELKADRLGVNYIGGIRRSQLGLRETNNAQQDQVVKLEDGYIGCGYWLFVLVGFCIIFRLMLPESRV